jgi:hypothetical protein
MRISVSHAVVGTISLLIGVFFVMASWESISEYMRVKEYAGFATGNVTNKHFSQAADGNSLYYIDYWFILADGKKISSTRSILKQHWDVLKVDDTLEIRYDKSNPNRNTPMAGGSVSLVYAFFVFILGAVFLIFGIMRLISGFKKNSGKKFQSH